MQYRQKPQSIHCTPSDTAGSLSAGTAFRETLRDTRTVQQLNYTTPFTNHKRLKATAAATPNSNNAVQARLESSFSPHGQDAAIESAKASITWVLTVSRQRDLTENIRIEQFGLVPSLATRSVVASPRLPMTEIAQLHKSATTFWVTIKSSTQE
ncbi:hypothetical protein AC579_4119 [Pseudocercospora musae]|uniref:Uncharacterized protein n=1 Tax=Pseudocercospora musae TaxID=113226 RepID=A0A139IDX2_9PEZI|nr:hypothetical protein AC579_4119 [Pseudocercospora musae]